MAGRDFDIPMGPDRTGRIDISVPEVVPGVGSPADQTIAHAPISTADLYEPDDEGLMVGGAQVDAWLSSPMEDASEADGAASSEAAGAVAVSDGNEAPRQGESFVKESLLMGDEADGDAAFEAEANEEVGEVKRVNNVAASLGALRDSIGQGRELKARVKDRDDLAEKIRVDREELADRDDILANYQTIVAEQDGIIEQNTQERDTRKAELSQVVAEAEDTGEALKRMRDYHDVQLEPLETALGRAQANADQAKNDERSRKSELNAAESEVRRAEEGDAANTARARLEVVRAAHDEAVSRSNMAKEVLEEAQRAYDTLREQVEQAEAPLERSLDELGKKTDELKNEVARLGDVIAEATKRRQYCDSVYQYPAETETLRQSIAADEEELNRMDEANDELRDLLAQSKAQSMKAKVVIGVAIAVVILVILLFWYLSSR